MKIMIRKAITVENDQGDPTKLASRLVQKASKFSCYLWIEEGSKRVNAKSIMGVLSMNLVKGTRFDLICTGEDEERAAQTLENLFVWGD